MSLRDAGESLGPGQITNTNRYTLRAALEEAGAEVVDAGVARDVREELAARLKAAAKTDLIVSTGGVSMGGLRPGPGAPEEQAPSISAGRAPAGEAAHRDATRADDQVGFGRCLEPGGEFFPDVARNPGIDDLGTASSRARAAYSGCVGDLPGPSDSPASRTHRRWSAPSRADAEWFGRVVRPVDASTPISPGVRIRPRTATVSPRRMSLPA